MLIDVIDFRKRQNVFYKPSKAIEIFRIDTIPMDQNLGYTILLKDPEQPRRIVIMPVQPAEENSGVSRDKSACAIDDPLLVEQMSEQVVRVSLSPAVAKWLQVVASHSRRQLQKGRTCRL